MQIRVTVYNVAESTESNSAIGLVSGNLLWASSELSGYKVGLIDHTSISGLTRSVANIVNGGTFSTGFTGTIKLDVTSALLVSMLQAKSVSMNGKTCKIEASLNGTIWHGVAKFPITRAVITDEISVTLKISTETVADKKKIASTVVTQEMALDNPKSSAIGKTVANVFGNNVLYPLIYCEPKQGDLAVMTGANAHVGSVATDKLFNGAAFNVFDDNTLIAEARMMLTNDLSFVKGSSLLQCVGAWQSSVDSLVWLAFSFNGKELLANANAENADYLNLIKRAIIGQRIKATYGTGSGNIYTVVNAEWATHEVSLQSTDIETLWFQVNTTEIDNFTYTLPNYSESSTTGKVGINALQIASYNAIFKNTNLFTFSGLPTNTFEVTHFCFQLSSGLFIASAQADVSDCEIYGEVDGMLRKVNVPSTVEIIYKNGNWQLLKIPLAPGIDSQEAKFDEVSTSKIESYLLEQDLTYPLDTKLNGLIDVAREGGVASSEDGVATGLNLLTDDGFPITSTGHNSMSRVITYNTIYIRTVPEMLEPDTDVCVIPEFRTQLVNSNSYSQSLYYKASVKIDVYAISEGNVAIAKKRAVVDAFFTNTSVSSEMGKIYLKPGERSISFSNDVTSHEVDSKSAYELLEKSLTFSDNELPETKNQIRAFLVVISVDYSILVESSGIYIFTLDSRNLSKVFYQCHFSTSKTIAKKDLYLKCVDSSEVIAPIGIAKRILKLNNVTCDEDSFAEVESQQRTFFSTTSSNFDGQYTAESSESVSDAIDNICKTSLTAIWLDAEGTAKARSLTASPETVAYEFVGTDIKSGSLKISQGDLANTYSDFDFKILENVVSAETVVSMDTSAESFPEPYEFRLGEIALSPEAGYSFTSTGSSPSLYRSIIARGPSKNLINMLTPGTYWQFNNGTDLVTMRIDTTAPDISCPINSYGLRLGMKFIGGSTSNVFTGTVTARLWGPDELWKELVSGTTTVSYGLAKSMWERSKVTRELLGSEIKAPSELTQMTDPIWSSDKTALSNWIGATVNYCTKEKFAIKFETDITDLLFPVDVMSYVSFKWGIYSTNSVQGFVVERSQDMEKGVFGYTLVCYGSVLSLPTLLTEAGIPFSTEAGMLFELEDGSLTSVKISELVESTAEALAEAGAVIPTATENIANNKVSLTAVFHWISDPLSDAIVAIGNALSNKVDKVTSALQTMQGALKLPFLNLYSSTTSSAPTGSEEGAVWYSSEDEHLKVKVSDEIRTLPFSDENAPLLHADQHGYGESDPVSIDTRQISNMTPFARTLVDDATAADARTTLGVASDTATLTDSAASSTLPTAGAATALTTLLQQIRNNLKGIIGDFVSKTTTTAQSIASALTAPYLETQNVSSATNSVRTTRKDYAVSTGDIVDGFGVRNTFAIKDITGVENQILHIDVIRAGADNTGKLSVKVNKAGTVAEKLMLNADGNLVVSGGFKAAYLDKPGGTDTTALTGNVQTQLNGCVKTTGDQTIAGSKTFSATPSIPQLPPESTGGAADARFVADKIYPNFEGSFITSSGSVTLVHGEMRVVNANSLTVTLTNTPVLGTVSWLYYTPVSCSTGSLTLSFNDPIGVSRTYSKTATAGSGHLPHWIKCTRCLYGWAVEWETEA